MSKLARLRVLAYIFTLVMHTTNIIFMRWRTTRYPSNDKFVQQFKSLEYRFFTTWTFLLQIAYTIYSLVCDLLILKNSSKKDYKLPTAITDFRDIIFSALVWPCSVGVAIIFWGVYSYDRALIFPVVLDTVIPPISNHIIHTVIVPVVLWEVVMRPREEPKNHARNIMQLTLHLCAYLSVMFFTFIERGVWLYPIFRKFYGTIYFPISIAAIGILLLALYYLQWPLTKMVHSSNKKIEQKKSTLEKKVK